MGTISNRAKVGNPLPFDAIPREMATDPKLDKAKKDYFVAGRLLFYAQWDDHTTVADDTIARQSGIGIATVKRSLRRLEMAGWIRRRQARKTRENATGRVIVLCWKLPDFAEYRKALADDTSAEPISKGVAHQCANEALTPDRLESLTSARQQRVVVVEGGENSIPPQTPHSNDNDPDPGPSVLAFPVADVEPHREMVEDLGGSMAGPSDRAERVDVDAEAARPAPRVYPMAEGLPSNCPEVEAENLSPIGTIPATESRARPVVPPATPPPPRAIANLQGADDAYTAAQLEFLAGLTGPQRARFDELSPGRRREVIAPHTHRVCTDPAYATEMRRALAPRPGAATVRAMPATLGGLWEALPGAPATWPQLAAEMMCRHFGADEDRRLWPAFHALALAVWRGQFPPDGVLDALRQANKPGVRKRGALFNTALQRDHGWRW